MAYEGKSPDSDWIQLKAMVEEPDFPAGSTDVYKEGTLFYSNASGTAPTPKGVFVYTTDDGTATGTYGFQILSPNNNADYLTTGNLLAAYGGVPCGTIIPFAKDVSSTGLPTGYLLCDGSSVSQSSFATLYAVTGVAFGDGTTGTGAAGTGNFNIPDFRGLFMRGMDHGKGNDPDAGSRTTSAVGSSTGDNVGSYQADAFDSHVHNGVPRTAGANFAHGSAHQAASYYGGVQDTYATGGSETRPKNTYIDYIIRYL